MVFVRRKRRAIAPQKHAFPARQEDAKWPDTELAPPGVFPAASVVSAIFRDFPHKLRMYKRLRQCKDEARDLLSLGSLHM
jgi:hypothetical protein